MEQYRSTMVIRAVCLALICAECCLVLQGLVPKTMALRAMSNRDRYLTQGYRTPKTNYFGEREDDGKMGSVDNGITYGIEPFNPNMNSEELSSFIVDYANTIDQSVKEHTHKRGDADIEKHNSQEALDEPCACANTVEIMDFGGGSFPRTVEYRNCSIGRCKAPYVCKENLYNITVLKLRKRGSAYNADLREDLRRKWYAVNATISVGCMCSLEPYTYL